MTALKETSFQAMEEVVIEEEEDPQEMTDIQLHQRPIQIRKETKEARHNASTERATDFFFNKINALQPTQAQETQSNTSMTPTTPVSDFKFVDATAEEDIQDEEEGDEAKI